MKPLDTAIKRNGSEGTRSQAQKPKRRTTSRILARILLACLATFALLIVGFWLNLPLVPLPEALFQPPTPELEFVARDGVPLRIVPPDGSPFQRSVAYADIPETLVEATLAAEDRRFWNHHGLDWRASLRAGLQLIWRRHVVSGGSTISQQLIKLAAPRPRTLRTKLVETVQAMRLEQVWDKHQILAEYLNRLDYGNFNRGCASAAEFYFAKPLRDLSPAECAFLAALPQAPSRLNPRNHLGRAIKRQQWVLAQMRQAGWLTAEQFERAAAEHLRFAQPHRSFEAPHFVDLLIQNVGGPRNAPLSPSGGESSPQTSSSLGPLNQSDSMSSLSLSEGERAGVRGSNGALQLRTTLDLPLNRFAENVLHRRLAVLKPQHVSNGALVMLDNRTGDVLAMVGSEDYFAPNSGQVNAAFAPRSAGSTLKPFTYLLALEHGATPATIVADVPTEFSTPSGPFAPANYNHHCYGPIPHRAALANSLNIPAVKVLESVGGPEPLLHLLQSCGLTTLNRSPEEYGLGLTIGNAETRLLELANAYAALARLGVYRPCHLLLHKPGPQSPTDSSVRIADSSTAYLVADILNDNNARLLAFGPESPLRFTFPVACKTGTSSDFRDNWAFGYTPEFTVGVWVGNLDGSPMQSVSGVTGAAPILHDLFEHLHERFGTGWYAAPTNIIECWVDPLTGKRKPDGSHPADWVREKFLNSNLPPIEQEDDYVQVGREQMVRLPAEYRDWFASADNWLMDRAVVDESPRSVRIEFPQPGTTIYLDPDLPNQGGQLTLNARGPEQLHWHSDTLQLTNLAGNWTAVLAPGRHRLTVSAPAEGSAAETWVNVVQR